MQTVCLKGAVLSMGQRHAHWHRQYFPFGQRDWICRIIMLFTKLSRKDHNVPKKRNSSVHILQNEVICLINYYIT